MKISFIVKKPPVPSAISKLYAAGQNNYGEIFNADKDNRYSFCLTSFVDEEEEWETFGGGDAWTIGIKNNGELWGWGQNSSGQLGQGGTTTVTPTQLLPGTFTKIACGSIHTLVLKSDGTLWGTGNNGAGQLGLGATSQEYNFIQIATDVAHIACGAQHSMLIKNDGRVFGCGYNSHGGLGTNDESQKNVFTEALAPNHIDSINATSVSCGGYHSIITTDDGGFYLTGRNYAGELGFNDLNDRRYFTLRTGFTNVRHFAADHTSYLLTDTGDLYGCGDNLYGQLGINEGTTDKLVFTFISSNCLDMSAKHTSMLVLKTDGTLWGAGEPYQGETGFGNKTRRTTLTANGENGVTHIYGTDMDKTAIFRKEDSFTSDILCIVGEANNGIVPNVAKETYATLPFYSTNFQIKNHGMYYCYQCSCVSFVTEDGKMYGFGNNYYYELGVGNNAIQYALTRVGSDTDWDSVYNNDIWTHAIKTDGTLWAVGYNSGQLGTGNTSNPTNWIQIGSDTDWIQATGGSGRHALALKSDGTVWGTGEASLGALGTGNTTDRTSFTASVGVSGVTIVQTGGQHTAAITADGDLYMTGRNHQGQFGIASANVYSFIFVLPGISKVACGDYHSMVVKNDGTLWATGYNNDGQLGLGNKTQKFVWTQVGSDTDWVDIACSRSGSSALKSDGSLWGCGNNTQGHLGIGPRVDDEVSFKQEILGLKWRMIGLADSYGFAVRDL